MSVIFKLLGLVTIRRNNHITTNHHLNRNTIVVILFMYAIYYFLTRYLNLIINCIFIYAFLLYYYKSQTSQRWPYRLTRTLSYCVTFFIFFDLHFKQESNFDLFTIEILRAE